MIRAELNFMLRGMLRQPDPRVLRHVLRHASPADLVEELSAHPPEQLRPMLAAMEAPERARLFAWFPEDLQDRLLSIWSPAEAVPLLAALAPDDRADLYKRMPFPLRERLVPALDPATRADLLHLSAYPEGSAGAAMTTGHAVLESDWPAERALAALRVAGASRETIDICYVTDTAGCLLGTVRLRDLVLAEPTQPVAELMQAHPVSIPPDAAQREAVALIREHGLLALPVVEADGRLLGIVTVDDAMDIGHAEDVDQIARFGGTSIPDSADLDLRQSSWRQMYLVRCGWLVLLTVFGILTSSYVASQEALLAEVIVLAAFVAPIVGMGGNTGSQSATLVIRGMAMGELRPRWADVGFVLRREVPVVLAIGLTIAVVEVILAHFAKGVPGAVLLVVGLSMLACTVLGGVIGAMLPFAARRLGADPATLSAPMITSVMDLLGVTVYFGLAWAVLGGGL